MQPQGIQAVVRAILEGTGGKAEFTKEIRWQTYEFVISTSEKVYEGSIILQ